MKATGASALFGVAVDAPSDLYSIGHPGADLVTVAHPTTEPTATPGGAGALTGSFLYRIGFGTPDGAVTEPGPAKNTVAIAPVGTPGLDDAGFAGVLNASGFPSWDIEIDGNGTPDTFKYRPHGQTTWLETTVPCAGGAGYELGSGIAVSFLATTGHTIGDAWLLTVSPDPVSTSAHEIDLTLIEVAAGAGAAKVDRRIIERSDDGGATWAICGVLYNNSATIFTDDTAVLDTSKVLPTLNQTGTNYGYTFLEPDSFDLEPEFSSLPVMALLGTAGKPRSVPGPIKVTGSPKSDLRPADLLPFLVSGAGMPDSYSKVAGEPTWIATWAATTGKRNARSISAFAYNGSQEVVPNFLYQLACEELDIAFSGGKITGITPKFTGANYGISAPGVKVSGDGTWLGSFSALGQRYNADALTKSVFIKITAALSANVVKFKVSVDTHASVGGGSYGAEQTLYTNATSHNQTKGGAQYNDAIELADQNGINLGADVGSNRQPFTLVATAPLTTDLHVNDIYEILPTAAIPGVGSAPFSGTPARFSVGPRFTDAHVTIKQGGSVIEATSGSLKFKWPKKDVNALCAGARTVQDLPNEGFFGVDLTIQRYLDSSDNRNVIRTDSRAVVRVELEGERIPINPGVLSTYREAFYVDLNQVAFTSVKAPVTGQVLVAETITAEAEQPDNPSLDLYNLTLQTRQGWRLPS